MKAYFLSFVLGIFVGSTVMSVFHHVCHVWDSGEHEENFDFSLEAVTQPLPKSILATLDQYLAVDINSSTSISTVVTEELTTTPLPVVTEVQSGCPTDRPIHIVVLILTPPGSGKHRKAIRETWMQEYNRDNIRVTLKFMIGLLELDNDTIGSLMSENHEHGDLLLIQDVKDSFPTLTNKLLYSLKWADQNLEFDYLMKTDDDTYIRMDKVYDALLEINCEEWLHWGYFLGDAYPYRKGKWSEPKWYISCPHYMPYTYGAGYVLSRNAVQAMMQFPDRLTLYKNDDVSVGTWLAPFRIKRLHDIRFNVENQNHGCNNKIIITHQERTKTHFFYRQHRRYLKNLPFCSREREIIPAYIYNWTAPPVHCCKRAKKLL